MWRGHVLHVSRQKHHPPSLPPSLPPTLLPSLSPYLGVFLDVLLRPLHGLPTLLTGSLWREEGRREGGREREGGRKGSDINIGDDDRG